MEQRKSSPEDQQGVAAPAPPAWMRRTMPFAADRRARMLEHMARVRPLPRRSAVPAPSPSDVHGKRLIGDLFGHVVLFGLAALLFQSRIPLYLGAFVFLTDGERIERALGTIGIRLEPGTIGPDIVKGAAFWFGWFALLAALKGSAPAWFASSMPPATPSLLIAGVALLLATAEAGTTAAMRRAALRFGSRIGPHSLTGRAISLVVAIGVLALLALLGAL